MGDYLKAQYELSEKMTADDYLNEMRIIAEENGYELTENAEKIAKFRERTGLPIFDCPCDRGNPYRGCIGSLCRKEIEENGICHCQAYRKR